MNSIAKGAKAKMAAKRNSEARNMAFNKKRGLSTKTAASSNSSDKNGKKPLFTKAGLEALKQKKKPAAANASSSSISVSFVNDQVNAVRPARKSLATFAAAPAAEASSHIQHAFEKRGAERRTQHKQQKLLNPPGSGIVAKVFLLRSFDDNVLSKLLEGL